MIELRRYVTRNGKDVFGEWLAKLKDARAQAKIVIRLDRVVAGNFADCKLLREGLNELRIDLGTGLPRVLRNAGQDLSAASRGR